MGPCFSGFLAAPQHAPQDATLNFNDLRWALLIQQVIVRRSNLHSFGLGADTPHGGERPTDTTTEALERELKAGHVSFATLAEVLESKGRKWLPDNVYHKKREELVEILGKSCVPSMTHNELLDFENLIKEDHPRCEMHKGMWDLSDKTKNSASRHSGKSVQLPYILVLLSSKWTVKLRGSHEVLKDVPFSHLDFHGANTNFDIPEFNGKVKLSTHTCITRGYHQSNCKECGKEMSQLSGTMTSALVDGFSGPMEVAITSCVGVPRVWNFNAGLAETCGICFCCYYMPHNIIWFELWAANVLRDAMVGKSTKQRVAMAVVHDGGQVGGFMQKMELPFAYLYDLPVLLFHASELLNVFIDTGLMQRTVNYVTGSDDGTLRMWTVHGEKEVAPMPVGPTVCCVDVTHDWIFAGDYEGSVHKFHRKDYVLNCKQATHTKEVRSLTVALGFVFTASKDKTIKMSGIESLNVIRNFEDTMKLGGVICTVVGIEFLFTGGERGALRFSHEDPKAEAVEIKREKGKEEGMSHMVLNGRSLFMMARADQEGNLYWIHDAYKSEKVMLAKSVFTAREQLRSLALGGSHLFAATSASIYKLDAREPWEAPIAGINVTQLPKQVELKTPALAPQTSRRRGEVKDLKVFGEIAIVASSEDLQIFNTKTGDLVEVFKGHTNFINCIAVG